MQAAAGVITQEGGITSFAATTMRAMGKAAVASLRDCDADWENGTLTAHNQERSCLREGDTVTIDGATGLIYIGQKPITLANQDENFQTVMYWADRYKRLSVYSTAASVHDVTTAKRLGAEGIGLFRAEQFLLKEGRTDLFLKFILVEDELERQGYMTQLQPLVYSDFLALYNQLGNSNVSVLLLDTPLSEFLPSVKSVDFERDLASLAERLQLPVESCRTRIHALQSANPVMGLRGCRLSVMHPQITETLTKAIVGAAVEMSRGNFPVLPKIVVPCSFSEQEVDRVASLVTTVSDTICARAWDLASSDIQVLPSKVAVLVETPRACYKTAAIVRVRGVSDILVNSDAITDMVFGMHEDCSQGFMVKLSCVVMHYYYAL
jgi:pyruvate,orthophosphate dikinase